MRFAVAFLVFSRLAYPQAPLFGFLPNSGQFPAAVRFVRYSGFNFMYLTPDSFVLFNGVRVQIAGVAATATEAGVSPTTAAYNFYQGNDATKWMVNTHLFQAVTLSGAYPGIDARFTTSTLSGLGIGVGEIIFSIAPGADPSPIGVTVLNTGASPMNAPGGAIWYSGGRIPGVFAVNAQATQSGGGSATPVISTLSVNAAGVISVQLTGRNPALETDVAIQFTDYELNRFPATAGFHASTITYPTSFGQDGALVNSPCGSTCTKSVIADLDASGNPIWVTMFGGSGNDTAELATPVGNGVGVSGEATSSDFAVTAGAPHPAAGSAQDIFLAWFDGNSGQLRNATYGGLPGMAAVSQQVASPAGNLAVSGAQQTATGQQGFIMEWQPQTNQLVYTFQVGGANPEYRFRHELKPLLRRGHHGGAVFDQCGRVGPIRNAYGPGSERTPARIPATLGDSTSTHGEFGVGGLSSQDDRVGRQPMDSRGER